MEWKKLLSRSLISGKTEETPRSFRDFDISPFEKDYQQIVSMAAFRRLQDKTQVFPLAKSDFVRTRLTHSIEVSTIAKQLGLMCFQSKSKYGRQPLDGDESSDLLAERAVDIPAILACAGLLHDLGYPPFGHAGEDIIGDWFKEGLDRVKVPGKGDSLRQALLRSGRGAQMIADLENFEGNAQALRILCKARHQSEIDLHVSTVSALIKYPTISTKIDEKGPVIRHKPGCYMAEEGIFTQIAGELGTLDPESGVARHPLAYLVVAADDIAYCTADLEDAVKAGLVSTGELARFFQNVTNGLENAYHSGITDTNALIKYLKQNRAELEQCAEEPQRPRTRSEYRRAIDYTRELVTALATLVASEQDKAKVMTQWVALVRSWLMYVVCYRFSKSYDEIMSGKYDGDLFHDNFHSLTVALLKQAMKKFVFNSRVIIEPEVSAQTILSFLLDKFVPVAISYDFAQRQGLTSQDEKLMLLISPNYIDDFTRATAEVTDEAELLYHRILIVTDFISGMTDGYARTLYRRMSGID